MKGIKLIALTAAMGYAALGGTAMAGGDPAKGAKVFNKCKTCHTLEAGKHKMGPSLAGVVGRKAGSAEGFTKYSKALQDSGIVWNDDTLAAFLENPKKVVPGNKMPFGGLTKDDDREDVIAYIKAASK